MANDRSELTTGGGEGAGPPAPGRGAGPVAPAASQATPVGSTPVAFRVCAVLDGATRFIDVVHDLEARICPQRDAPNAPDRFAKLKPRHPSFRSLPATAGHPSLLSSASSLVDPRPQPHSNIVTSPLLFAAAPRRQPQDAPRRPAA